MKLTGIIDNTKKQFAFAGWGLIAGLLLLTGCERRELYVYSEEFKSASLDVDWRKYSSRNPDGMTLWFYPDDMLRKPYRATTANVRHHELYLAGGIYQGVVIDYSPEEYSNQVFFDLDDPKQARVEARPAAYQPDSVPDIYGSAAFHTAIPSVEDATGYYTVSDQPEEMALDTLKDMNIPLTEYGDYVPYKERDTYQSKLVVTEFQSTPLSIIQKVRIRIFLKGFNYLWRTNASLAGLSKGHYLVKDQNTNEPCLIALDDWELIRTGDNQGYIATTITSFGLRPNSIKNPVLKSSATRAPGDTEPDYPSEEGWDSYYTDLCLPEELRLNLHFVLRDHATELNYHFDVGNHVVFFENQHVLRIDLTEEDFENDPSLEPIVLPYVEPYNGTGFDADVTDWEDEPPVDIDF